ncbi:MAG: SixA phosphatase family protein [Pseudohongiellaceae bacterium]
MKTLYLLRHAKSSWENRELKDAERPLNDRGVQDVPMMAARFTARQDDSPDCIISSPANRAHTTATLFAKAIGFPASEITNDSELYFSAAFTYRKAARLVDESCQSAMLVGHNPSITDFANEITNGKINYIPTCGLVKLSLAIANWAEIDSAQAELVEFDYPKK